MADNDLTYQIIGVAMDVQNELGPGLREKPYENALCIELRDRRFQIEQQRPFPIRYKNEIVGDCIPDIIVDGTIIVDAKSIDRIGENEIAQMLNYLRIAEKELGLIINFKNPKIEVKRVAR